MAKDKYGIITDEKAGTITCGDVTYNVNEIEHDNVILALIVRGLRRDFAQSIGGIVKELNGREPTPKNLNAKFKAKFDGYVKGEMKTKVGKSEEQKELEAGFKGADEDTKAEILEIIRKGQERAEQERLQAEMQDEVDELVEDVEDVEVEDNEDDEVN